MADFGAGKSPIPIKLASLGFTTHVVDPHQLLGFTNEWDFRDYSPWGVTTHFARFEDPVFAIETLDIAVSVSVIEHLTADARRVGLAQVNRALVSGGLAVFTIDVIPGPERYLWNRVVEVIEPPHIHGTVDTLKGLSI